MSRRKQVEIFITAQDRASEKFKSVDRNAQNMGRNLKQSGRHFESLSRTAYLSINKIGTSMRQLDSYLGTLNSRVNNVFGGVNTAMKVGVAGTAALATHTIYSSSRAYSEFEKQHAKTMGSMASSYGKTRQEQQRFMRDQQELKKQAIELGRDPNSPYFASEVSAAQTSLVKAGLQGGNISKITPSAIEFAYGNEVMLNTATEWGADIASMFEVPAAKWGEMFDKLTKAADISTIDVDQIYDTLKYAAQNTEGKATMEEILGMTAIMGNRGLKDTMAGTGLAAIMSRLLNPRLMGDKKAENAPSGSVEALDKITTNIIYPKTGGLKDWPVVIDIINNATKALNVKAKDFVLEQIAGLENKKALAALMSAGGKEIKEAIDEITYNSSGINKMKAELLRATQSGSWTALSKAMEGIKTQFGEGISPLIRSSSEEMANFFNGKGIQWGNVYQAIDEMIKKLRELNPEVANLAGNISTGGVNAVRAGAAAAPTLGGVGRGIAELLSGNPVKAWEDIQKGIAETDKNIAELPEELRELATAAKNAALALSALAAFNIVATFAGKAKDLFLLLESVFKPFGQLLKKLYVDPYKEILGKKTPATPGQAADALKNMTVYADIVNVYGKSVNFTGDGTNPGKAKYNPKSKNPQNTPTGGQKPLELPSSPNRPSLNPAAPEGYRNYTDVQWEDVPKNEKPNQPLRNGPAMGAFAAIASLFVASAIVEKSKTSRNNAELQKANSADSIIIWDADKYQKPSTRKDILDSGNITKSLLSGFVSSKVGKLEVVNLQEFSDKLIYQYQSFLPGNATKEQITADNKQKALYHGSRALYDVSFDEYMGNKKSFDDSAFDTIKKSIQEPTLKGFQDIAAALNKQTPPPIVNVDVTVDKSGAVSKAVTYQNVQDEGLVELRRRGVRI